MQRDSSIAALRAGVPWDVLIIGGGAVGLGVAVEAAARGYRTALVERSDFSAGTSSRSTKLIHGGLRYLPQGRVTLVREALREREELLAAVPELVRPLPFLLPCKHRWQLAWCGLGVAAYDRLAGGRRATSRGSTFLSAESAVRRIPNLRGTSASDGGSSGPDRATAPSDGGEPKSNRGRARSGATGATGKPVLAGAVAFHDAQFDDARFAIRLVRFAQSLGALLVNYSAVEALLHKNGRACGAVVRDAESGSVFEVESRAVVNATGPFADAVRRLDDPGSTPRLMLSRGSHVVLPGRFLGGTHGLVLPRGEGRVHFSIPWHGHTLVGTTEVVMDEPSENPQPSREEITGLLAVLQGVLVDPPRPSDLTSAFAGVRALVRPANVRSGSASVSREHAVVVSSSGLVSVLGGKWTLYRKVAAEAVDAAAESAGLRTEAAVLPTPRSVASADKVSREARRKDNASWQENVSSLDPRGVPDSSLSCSDEDIDCFVRDEMARTVDDVLSRRTRVAFLDVRAGLDLAPRVAVRMAQLLQRDDVWIESQIRSFHQRWGPIAELVGR